MALFIKQSPFFRLFLFTISGIITAKYFEIESMWILPVALVLWAVLLVVYGLIKNIKIDIFWGFGFNVLCFIVGFILAQNAKPLRDLPDFENNSGFTVIIEQNEGRINNRNRYLGRLYFADNHKFLDKTVKVRILADTTETPMKEGDIIFCTARLQKIENRGNPGELDYKTWANRKQIYYSSFVPKGKCTIVGYDEPTQIKQWISSIRIWIEQCFTKFGITGNQNAVLIALTTGDKASLDPELKSAFTTAGLMHVLAVSGLHVGIIYLVLSWIVKPLTFFRQGRILRIVIVITALWLYAFFTGMAPSVKRAVLMFSFLVVGEASGRKYSGQNSLFASAFFLMIFNPNIIFELGFQLSYLAVFGIFQFHKPIYNLFCFKNKLLDKIWSLSALSISAQLATTPISLLYFNQFPLYFLLGNIVIVPLVGVIIQGAILFMALSFYAPLAKIVAWCVNLMLKFMTGTTELIAKLPYSQITGIYIDVVMVIALYALFLIAHSYFKSHSPRTLVGLSTLLCSLLIYSATKSHILDNTSDIHVFKTASSPIYIVESKSVHSIVADTTAPVERHIAQLSNFYGARLNHASHNEVQGRYSVWEHPAGKILIAPENILSSIDTTIFEKVDVVVRSKPVWKRLTFGN